MFWRGEFFKIVKWKQEVVQQYVHYDNFGKIKAKLQLCVYLSNEPTS